MAIHYLDRYLASVRLTKPQDQFNLALACFQIAAKFAEECGEPTPEQLVAASGALCHGRFFILMKDIKVRPHGPPHKC